MGMASLVSGLLVIPFNHNFSKLQGTSVPVCDLLTFGH